MKLVIRTKDHNDYGTYKCIANNTLGESEKVIHLHRKLKTTTITTKPLIFNNYKIYNFSSIFSISLSFMKRFSLSMTFHLVQTNRKQVIREISYCQIKWTIQMLWIAVIYFLNSNVVEMRVHKKWMLFCLSLSLFLDSWDSQYYSSGSTLVQFTTYRSLSVTMIILLYISWLYFVICH